jgi:hypothetical protein
MEHRSTLFTLMELPGNPGNGGYGVVMEWVGETIIKNSTKFSNDNKQQNGLLAIVCWA